MVWLPRGHGRWIPVIWFAALAVTDVSTNAVLGAGYYQQHDWPKFLGTALAGAVFMVWGKRLNRTEARWPHKHGLLLVPMEYWAPLSLALMAALLNAT